MEQKKSQTLTIRYTMKCRAVWFDEIIYLKAGASYSYQCDSCAKALSQIQKKFSFFLWLGFNFNLQG
jgi:hypothetical protein